MVCGSVGRVSILGALDCDYVKASLMSLFDMSGEIVSTGLRAVSPEI